MVSGSGYLTLTFTKVIADTDITYLPQVSGDLAAWNSGASYVATVSTTNNADGLTQTVVVRDLTAMTGAGQRFIRLAVTDGGLPPGKTARHRAGPVSWRNRRRARPWKGRARGNS